MSESKHPELHAFMDNLYQASGNIDFAVEQGLELAKGMQYIRAETSSDALFADWVTAAQQVRTVADELEISLAHQYRRGLQSGHIRLVPRE